jgi:hypothetical protein
MQGTAAEMMRVVFIRASHLPLIGCAHDSFLVEGTIENIEAIVAEMQDIMRKTSRDLLGGFELRADCKSTDITRYPDRSIDKREREDGMGRRSTHRRNGGNAESNTATAVNEEKTEDAVQGEMGKISASMDDGTRANQERERVSAGSHDFVRGI